MHQFWLNYIFEVVENYKENDGAPNNHYKEEVYPLFKELLIIT